MSHRPFVVISPSDLQDALQLLPGEPALVWIAESIVEVTNSINRPAPIHMAVSVHVGQRAQLSNLLLQQRGAEHRIQNTPMMRNEFWHHIDAWQEVRE